MRVAIITFPGSNCDYDCYKASTDVLRAEAFFLWHRGGFSYGDYLRAGAIARFSPVMESVLRFARDGGPVLGICNGFQVLCEVGLLPGALVRNTSLKFRSRPVHVRVDNADTPFTRDYDPGQVLSIHIAHGQGNYTADEATLDRLEAERRVVFRYVDAHGRPDPAANPNGSARNIAGIINEAGNVLGLMPHPERAVERILGSTDGVALFTSIRGYIEARAGAAGAVGAS